MRKLKSLSLIFGILFAGCASVTSPVTSVHPAWACNPGLAAGAAGSIAYMVTSSLPIIAAAPALMMVACNIEASLVAGPPAQSVSTTTTTTSTTKPAQ